MKTLNKQLMRLYRPDLFELFRTFHFAYFNSVSRADLREIQMTFSGKEDRSLRLIYMLRDVLNEPLVYLFLLAYLTFKTRASLSH